jgi:hypothetical protein
VVGQRILFAASCEQERIHTGEQAHGTNGAEEASAVVHVPAWFSKTKMRRNLQVHQGSVRIDP